MKTICGTKYRLLGYRSCSDVSGGWWFQEIPKDTEWETCVLIVNEAKFINDGKVYFLLKDGVCQYNHHNYRFENAVMFEYEYELETC